MPCGKQAVEVSVSGVPAFFSRMRFFRRSMYCGFSGAGTPSSGPSRYW